MMFAQDVDRGIRPHLVPPDDVPGAEVAVADHVDLERVVVSTQEAHGCRELGWVVFETFEQIFASSFGTRKVERGAKVVFTAGGVFEGVKRVIGMIRKVGDMAVHSWMQGYVWVTDVPAAVTGTEFFRSLVQHLAAGLHVRFAFVAESRSTSAVPIKLTNPDARGS